MSIRPLATPQSRVLNVVLRYPLTSFFVLAFSLSWGVGAALAGVPVVAPDGLFVGGVPVAAIVVTALTAGRAGLRDLGHRLLRFRVATRWYVAVFALPVLLVGAAVALIPTLGGSALDWSKRPGLASTALLLVIFLLLPIGAPLGEEIGWRGFALPRLLARHSALAASLILGVIWSLWHLPGVLADPTLRVPVPFHLQVIPLAVLFTWLFVNTKGSLFIAVLFHAWNDLVLQYLGAMVAPGDYERMWWLLLASLGLAAVAVVVATGPEHLSRTHRKPVTTPCARPEPGGSHGQPDHR
jgi:membrane protease YdiL (CAAX protease family)